MAEVAMQYNDSYNELVLSFANNIHTPDGGTHEAGFKAALTRDSTTTPASMPFSRTATRTSRARTSGKG